MPYHVRLTPKSDRSKDEVKLDLTQGELEERVLRPYRFGQPITLKGRTFPITDIERLRINFTDEPSEVLRPHIEAREERRRRGSSIMVVGGPSLNWYIAASGRDVTDELITGPPGAQADSHPADETPDRGVHVLPATPRQVMVVHARNLEMRDAMFAFLQSLDLRPLEWSELRAKTGKTAPYVGEILDVAFAEAQAVVVLLTPDDEARLRQELHQPGDPPHETELTFQARPNVLFEAGMAMGRNPDRTIIVEIGDLRPFSDIGGRHVVRMSNRSEDRQELANRLKDSGCPVNLAGTLWHKAGDFSLEE